MKIRIENDDKIFVKNNCIEVYANCEKYCFDRSEIEEISIITTDLGPFYDDMGLAIRINKKETIVIFILSGHPLFRNFLFDELKQIVDIDYKAVIDAASCVENKIFSIYKRQ